MRPRADGLIDGCGGDPRVRTRSTKRLEDEDILSDEEIDYPRVDLGEIVAGIKKQCAEEAEKETQGEAEALERGGV